MFRYETGTEPGLSGVCHYSAAQTVPNWYIGTRTPALAVALTTRRLLSGRVRRTFFVIFYNDDVALM
jgi:hypothetical protein